MNKTIISNKAYRQVLAIISLGFLFVFLYLYFLNLSVVQVVMRKEADHAQADMRAEISLLETRYIEAQHVIAARIGDLEDHNTEASKTFITRGASRALVQAN